MLRGSTPDNPPASGILCLTQALQALLLFDIGNLLAQPYRGSRGQYSIVTGHSNAGTEFRAIITFGRRGSNTHGQIRPDTQRAVLIAQGQYPGQPLTQIDNGQPAGLATQS